MRKSTQIHMLYLLLLVLVSFSIFALYMSQQTQQTYNESSAAKTADYNYEEIQVLVELPEQNTKQPEPEPDDNTPSYDTQEMLSLNPDFKGWLWIPETNVNYPVVQSEDNNTYLYRSFLGEYSSYGSLFLDQNSLPGSQNRVIHGHNMGNGRTEMFSELINYQDQEWAGEREYIYFLGPDDTEHNRYRLFAVLNFDVNHLNEFNYLRTTFQTKEDFHSFVSYLQEQSLYHSNFVPETEILILSTCNRAYGADNRLLVCFSLDADS